MPIPNNTIEFLTSERNKQTPPYRGFYDEAIAALESGWISVEDRLPERYVRVLVFSPPMADSDVGGIAVQWGWCCHQKRTEISHWMPLPEPPKGKKNGQKK